MRKILVIFVAFLSVCSTLAQTSELPYFCGFETDADTVGWCFKTGRRVQSNFTVGRAVHRIGVRSIYVSTDSGATAGYIGTTSGFITVASRKFYFKAGMYDMNFDLSMACRTSETADYFRLACIPLDEQPKAPTGANSGMNFSTVTMLNTVADRNDLIHFADAGWKNITVPLRIPADGEYWLAFYFREPKGDDMLGGGAVAVDNIQIDTVRATADCTYPVSDINTDKKNGHLNITWKGNATEYELMYYNTTHSDDTAFTFIPGINSTSYSIPLTVVEGCYNFRIRPICPPDTGLWTEESGVVVYDPAAHCLDYLNFYAPGVTCTSGVFDNPYQTVGVKDFGSSSVESMHTVHYNTGEYDRLTGYKLKTVPDGSFASVRLSNWSESPAPSGSIEYTYTVRSDAKVLLLRYAVVLQYANHPAEDQTRIHVQILDTAGNLLSHCAEADFNARDVDEGNTRGWQTYNPRPGEVAFATCPIKWLDWSILGINMKDYVGQKVKIRITLYACTANVHFGYAYFTLDCSRGDMEGMKCGVVPNHFTVPEGFDYKWYKMSDGTVVPDNLLSDGGRTFNPVQGDTASYFVDLIYPENDSCRFTLSAHMLPREPKSDMSYLCRPRDCQNVVEFTSLSFVYSKYNDEPEILRPDTIDTYLWDFGPKYGTSQEKNPQLVVPLAGDTFTVVLQTGYNNCYDTKEFTVEVPAIPGESHGSAKAYICENDSVQFNGKWYDKPGDYVDTLTTVYGCDSILSLHLEVLVPDSMVTDSVACSDDVIEFFGQKCDTTGVYVHHVPSSMGCDTLYYEMRLTVLDALDVALGTDYGDVCSSEEEEEFDVPYTVGRGEVSAYSVDYGEAAERVGFVDVDSVEAGDGFISLLKPGGVRPGRYGAAVTFYNSDCGNLVLPFEFEVKYPSEVIAQRWNDVLAVKNAEHNGGYDFVGYQWYLEGLPIEGAIRSQHYAEGGMLEFGKEYSVLLTRADDGVSVMTCVYTPTEFETEKYTEVSSVVFGGSEVAVEVDRQAVVRLYTVSGLRVSEQRVYPGANSVVMPMASGVYLLRVDYADGASEVHRVVVR